MIRQYTLFCLIFIIMIGISCQSPADKVVESDISIRPGILTFTTLSGLDKSMGFTANSSITEPDTNIFDLGAIKASKYFYFILKNTGGNPITDINIQSSNTQFGISPTYINSLEPDSLSSFVPIISMSALHGTTLDGIGFTEIMPMGKNSSIITINGVTSDASSDSIPINLTALISVEALVMDIRLFTPEGEVVLSNPRAIQEGLFNGISVPLPMYIQSRILFRSSIQGTYQLI